MGKMWPPIPENYSTAAGKFNKGAWEGRNEYDKDYAVWWLHLKVLLLQQQPLYTQKPLGILDENCFVSEFWIAC